MKQNQDKAASLEAEEIEDSKEAYLIDVREKLQDTLLISTRYSLHSIICDEYK